MMTKLSLTKKAIILSFLSGFLSLSIEVIWIRLFGFFSGGLPQVFSVTLALFLFGIAIGALFGKRICQETSNSNKLLNEIGKYFLLAGVADLILLSLLIFIPASTVFVFAVGMIICATLRGVAFPIVHHIGTQTNKTGAGISNVYFANVIGSTIAPILIGFVLLGYFTTQTVYLIIALSTMIVSYFCLDDKRNKIFNITALIACGLLLIFPQKLMYNLSNFGKSPDWQLEHLIENKHGVIQVFNDGHGEYIVYGGNAYDGHINTSLFNIVNRVSRAYYPLVVRPDAKDVLVIGLSTGSWTQILTLLPNLESITIVELNPGYTEFKAFSADMKALVGNPKVTIITDDGRRFINRNQDKKYDLILMNTTHYYRNQATSILSQQFLEGVKKSLSSNGIVTYNTTGFEHSFFTAKSVFPYVYQYENMAIASNNPIKHPNEQQLYERLSRLKWQHTQQPVFQTSKDLQRAVNIMKSSAVEFEDIKFRIDKTKLEVITDQNMINEYKYGYFNRD